MKSNEDRPSASEVARKQVPNYNELNVGYLRIDGQEITEWPYLKATLVVLVADHKTNEKE